MSDDDKVKYRLMSKFWKDSLLIYTCPGGVNEYTIIFKDEKSREYNTDPKNITEKINSSDYGENNRYFSQIVKDCVNDVKKIRKGYCFSKEQLSKIIRELNKIGISNGNLRLSQGKDTGIWYIKRI